MNPKHENSPLTIKFKDLEIEISKEQALRSGIAKQVFEGRHIFEPSENLMDFKNKVKELIESDCEHLSIKIAEFTLVGIKKGK